MACAALTAIAFLLAGATAGAGARARAQKPLRDKTLVVWAAPANLAQHGGSALTLDDNESHFDGIVFGELSPGRWMPGSDFYRRTARVQESWPAETAGPTTTVQIAIVYRDKEVTLLRNGIVLTRYTIAAPQEFGPESAVVFGLRHLDATDRACFAGAIEDARIYAGALAPEVIARLRPKVASAVRPWAWWTFDNRGATDRTGRFKTTRLVGGAIIKDGKLMLDGKQGAMVCETGAPQRPETPRRPAQIPDSWLTFHLTHPGPGEAMPGDPNCAFLWKGEYHLHYIYNHHGFSFAHLSSADLIHWKWHPTTLTPRTMGHGMFSGTGFINKAGRPTIIYHGEGSGRNQLAVAEDGRLEKWSRPWPLEPTIRPGQDGSKIANWDPDAWLEGDTYYALSGGNPGSGKPPTLFRSSDLHHWDYLGLFLSHDMPDVLASEDISCPNFFKIGGKRMLLCISHNLGCRYYLGEWKDEKFTPDTHGRMSWNGRNYFAPESVLTADGRRVMWAWLIELPLAPGGVQALPRELELPSDGVLRIRPLRELAMLRHDPHTAPAQTLRPGAMVPLAATVGDAAELRVTFRPTTATEFGLNVLCDKGGANGVRIAYTPETHTLHVGKVEAPFHLAPGEDLNLRVFLDKNLVEVFANDRQAAAAAETYVAGNTGVRLYSDGGDTTVDPIHTWKLRSIYRPR